MAKKTNKKVKQIKRTMTNVDVFNVVENEGLGYAVQYYMGSKEFVDLELAGYWNEAKEALNKIQEILDKAEEEANSIDYADQ